MVKRTTGIGDVSSLATPESFSRGRQYFRDGAVGDVVRRNDVVSAHVEGSEAEPYRVTVRLVQNGVAEASCSCPYSFGGYCKHIVAVLLKCSECPADIVVRPTVSQLLADLDKDQLIALIVSRAEADSSMAGWIEAELATAIDQFSAKGKRTKGRKTLVDPGPIQEQAQALLRGRYQSRHHWDEFPTTGSQDDLQRLIDKAQPFLDAGDGRNALRILESITATLVKGWIEDAHAADEHVQYLLYDLGHMIAEAALMADFKASERDDLARRIKLWHRQLSPYGLDDCFDVAEQALETGWDDTGLNAILKGKARAWPPNGQTDHAESQLTGIRLRVLSATNRTKEYLRFAAAAGAHAEHATMLVKLSRVPDALAYAAIHFTAPLETLDLAKALREAGEDDRALELGESGLSLTGQRPVQLARNPYRTVDSEPYGLANLASWLRDYAGAVKKLPLALKAATITFEQTLALEDFRAAEILAKASGKTKSWAKARQGLLSSLANAKYARDRTLIYLEEGLIDDAVRGAGEPSDHTTDNGTLMRLADAAIASHSDWVIRFASARAATIMDNNHTSRYQEAATWLEKVALAFEAAGQEDEWARLLETLIDKHKRKYKLRPLLEALR